MTARRDRCEHRWPATGRRCCFPVDEPGGRWCVHHHRLITIPSADLPGNRDMEERRAALLGLRPAERTRP